MLRAFKKRPSDFKRRILQMVSTKAELVEAENRWLSFIKPEELNTKYYNLSRYYFGGDVFANMPPEQVQSIMQKAIQSRKWYSHSKETRAKMSTASMGRPKSAEARLKMSVSAQLAMQRPERRAQILAASKKGAQASAEKQRGKPKTYQTRLGNKGKIWITNGQENQFIAKDQILPDGWWAGLVKRLGYEVGRRVAMCAYFDPEAYDWLCKAARVNHCSLPQLLRLFVDNEMNRQRAMLPGESCAPLPEKFK